MPFWIKYSVMLHSKHISGTLNMSANWTILEVTYCNTKLRYTGVVLDNVNFLIID
jgi:hypothetical protein